MEKIICINNLIDQSQFRPRHDDQKKAVRMNKGVTLAGKNVVDLIEQHHVNSLKIINTRIRDIQKELFDEKIKQRSHKNSSDLSTGKEVITDDMSSSKMDKSKAATMSTKAAAELEKQKLLLIVDRIKAKDFCSCESTKQL